MFKLGQLIWNTFTLEFSLMGELRDSKANAVPYWE